MIKTFEIGAFAVSLDFDKGKFLVGTSAGRILSITESTGEIK